MNSKLKLVDVTIREGSNLNWNISKLQILKLIKLYKDTNVDFLEIGYLNNKGTNFLNKYNKEYLKNCLKELKGSSIKISLLSNLEKFDFNIIEELKNYNIGILRFAYNKNDKINLVKLKKYIGLLKKKKIKVSLNITRINNYSLEELNDLLKFIENFNFDLIYIADTDGKLLPDQFKSYLKILKNNFYGELGFHPHNHSGLAMVNSLIAIENGVKYIDISLLGFGKGMSNLHTEKFLIYLANLNNNFTYLKNFDNIIKFFIPLISKDLGYSKELEQKFLYSIFSFFNFTLKDNKKLEQYCNRNGLNYFYVSLDLFFYYKGNLKKFLSNIQNYKVKLLNDIVEYCKVIPYYENLLSNIKVNEYSDFLKIPFLDKNTYRENTQKNKKLFAIDRGAFIFSSGGTTSKPRYIYRDFEDIKNQYEYFKGLKLNKKDVVLNLFMPGIWGVFTTSNIALSYYECKVIPLGGNNLDNEKLEFILQLGKKFKINTLIGVPSTILRISKFFEKKGYNKIKKIYCLGEKIYPSIKNYFLKLYGNDLNLISIYGCMEAAGMGYQDLEINGDYYKIFPYQFIEIINPNTGKVLDYGEEGEIVVTTLKKRLVPLLRFKTGDYGKLINKNNYEILYVSGRTEELLISATIHLELSHIDNIIEKYNLDISFFQLHVYNKGKLDNIILKVETNNKNLNNIKFIEFLRNIILEENYDLKEALESKKIGVFTIETYKEGTLERNILNGKLKRIFDMRK